MKTAKFKHANFERIRARVYDEIPQPDSEKSPARGLGRAPAMALVLAALAVVCTVSVAAATGAIDLGAIYRAVFGAASVPFASEAGGTACVSEGIQMEVVSVVADANGFYAFIEMTDLTGQRRLGYRAPDSEGDFAGSFWGIGGDFGNAAKLYDDKGFAVDIHVADTGEAWPADHMTAVAALYAFGELKAGFRDEVHINRLINAAGQDISGQWTLPFSIDRLAKTRKLRARYGLEEISVAASPISVNITVKFDPGAWRDLFADDPYNIPAVMYLTDGSEVEMTYNGAGGLIETDPPYLEDSYYTVKYNYDLLDTGMIDRIEFDQYVFSFADGGKVTLK
jgi:hypothetical protein